MRALVSLIDPGADAVSTIEQALASGIYRDDRPGRFTDAYLFPAGDVIAFFEQAGFRNSRLLAAQGFLGFASEQVAALRRRDDDAYDRLLDLAYATAEDPSIHGLAAHLVYVGRNK